MAERAVDAGFEANAECAGDASSTFRVILDSGWRPDACSPDLLDDPQNCGFCGNDCLGGACSAGSCAPLTDQLLATGQAAPVGIAVDGQNVYWLNNGVRVSLTPPGTKAEVAYFDGQVLACPADGCGNAPTVLAAGWNGVLNTLPSSLTRSGNGLFWVGGTSAPGATLFTCGVHGGDQMPTAILGNMETTGVAVVSPGVFFTQYSTGDVAEFTPGCGAVSTTFASGQVGPMGIVADDSNVYWTDINGTLASCPLSGCGGSPNVLWRSADGEGAGTQALAVDANNVYWTNTSPIGTGSVLQCAKTACASTTIVLALGRNSPFAIAVDATKVYWTEGDHSENSAPGAIFTCAIGGCGDVPQAIAPSLSGWATAIAVDGANVYWTEWGRSGALDGTVHRVAK